MNYDYTKDAILESLLSRSFEIDESDTFEPVAYFEPALEGIGAALPILDEEDRDILLHRDAHFAGSFPLMLKAYEDEEKSAVLDVEPKRIRKLFILEQQLKKNLAPFILHAADAQKINAVRKMYRLLKESMTPIGDLILSEEEPEKVAKEAALIGEELVPSLLAILSSELFYDPLFPGYGEAPIAFALALGLLKAKQAIPTLFSLIQNENFDIESAALTALCQIGDAAKQFCIDLVHARPLTLDNVKAAIAIANFPPDDTTIEAVLDEIKDPAVYTREPLISYLLASIEHIPEKWHGKLKGLAAKSDIPQKIKQEIVRQIGSNQRKSQR